LRADTDRVPEKLGFHFYFEEGEMGKEYVMNDTKDTQDVQTRRQRN